jgi:hypothetical protein
MSARARIAFSLLLLALCLGVRCEARQLAIVTEKSNTAGAMATAELAKVFKFETRKWPDGRNIVLVLRDPSTPEMQTIIQKLYKMQPEEFKALLALHRGGFVLANSEQELLKSVESIPGAVGLVDVYSINSRVNVMKIDGKLPLEAGYVLKGD